MRRRAQIVFIAISVLLTFGYVDVAQADSVAFSTVNTGCAGPLTNSNYYVYRYVAGTSSVITSLQIPLNNISVSGYQTAFNSSIYYIRADNAGYVGAALDTLTAGTLSSSSATFVGGTYKLTKGQKFWIVPGQPFTTLPACYANPPTITKSYGWTADYSAVTPIGYFGINNTNPYASQGGYVFAYLSQLAIIIKTPSISLSSANPNPVYMTSTTLTASADMDTVINFTSNGKRIPNCLNVKTVQSGPNFIATCNWKPATHGVASIVAVSSAEGIPSPGLSIRVVARTNTR